MNINNLASLSTQTSPVFSTPKTVELLLILLKVSIER